MAYNLGGKGRKAFIIIFPQTLLCQGPGHVALFSVLVFMYILLSSLKSSRHPGLENEK
jgi:hypothetical protein